MNVAIFGASGMLGQGVLRECLKDPSVQQVISIGRTALDQQHPKLLQLTQKDLFDLSPLKNELGELDACFFCLGVSSAGLTEAQYRHLTYDLTTSAAAILLSLNPGMRFVYVSGTGTDSTEQGKTMWARVKGATENALLRMPFKGAFMFRPGVIIPLNGIKSKTRSYQLFYDVFGPLLKLLFKLRPGTMTTTENIGLAMLNLAKYGGPQTILDGAAINAAAQRAPN